MQSNDPLQFSSGSFLVPGIIHSLYPTEFFPKITAFLIEKQDKRYLEIHRQKSPQK